MKKNIFIFSFVFVASFFLLTCSTTPANEINTYHTLIVLLKENNIELKSFPSDVKEVQEVDAPGYTIVAKELKKKIELACECSTSNINIELLKKKLDISLREKLSIFQHKNINIIIERSYDKKSVEFLSKTAVNGLYGYKYQAKMFTIFHIEVKSKKILGKNIQRTEIYHHKSISVFDTISKLL
jgi:hypothetical protein